MTRVAAAFAALALFASAALFAGSPGIEVTVGKGGTTIVTKDEAAKKKTADAPRIDLALLLDTSNSMDGLINQARAQLWKVVNDLATAEKGGKTPLLRVALYEYGNSGLPADGGYVRQVLPLSDDLDKVSEKLFALSTNGGDEYCGRVIEAATQGLDWSSRPDDLKLIVIAGNEPFTQGPTDYKQSCKAAIEHSIVINTVFCGDRKEGIESGWQDGAKLADGSYSNIDQNKQVADIATPFDAELGKLSGEINGTYLFFGAVRLRRGLETNQAAQDSNAAGLGGGVAAARAATKAGNAYRYAESDLVDKLKTDGDALKSIKDEELPEELKGKSEAEKQAIVEKHAAERAALQKRIAELSAKRDKFVAEERKKQAAVGGAESLDEALIRSFREQAAKKDYSFKK